MASKSLEELLTKYCRDGGCPERKARFETPALATLTDDYFDDPDWIYERKFDGERVVAVKAGKRVTLYSRNEKTLNDSYPEVVEALAAQPGDFVIDGEVVAFEGNRTSFARLQGRIGLHDPARAAASGIAVYYYVFDLISAGGYALDGLPLTARKTLLRAALAFSNRVRFTPHRREKGIAYRGEACRKGWEGVIAKNGASRYAHKRTRDWLKFKCVRDQELVVGGFTDPKGSRIGFGALLVGYYDGSALRYAGKVGTGYDDETLRDLRKRLDRIARDTSPFDDPVRERDAHFVTPELVAQVGFTEWTRDHSLRHPRFLGLRRDKAAKDVVREAADG
jgi:bifunctional non-homologous end joining protein LigD